MAQYSPLSRYQEDPWGDQPGWQVRGSYQKPEEQKQGAPPPGGPNLEPLPPSVQQVPKSPFPISPVAPPSPIAPEPPKSPFPPPSDPIDIFEDEENDDFGVSPFRIGAFVAVLVIILSVGGWFLFKSGAPVVPPPSNQPVTPPAPMPGPTPAPVPIPIPVPPPQLPNLITAATGGAVTSSDGGATVIIPPGALQQDTVINVELSAQGSVMNTYHLMPDGLKFNVPVFLLVNYKESGLPKGFTPERIQLEYVSSQSNLPVRKLNFTVDRQNRQLRTEIMEF